MNLRQIVTGLAPIVLKAYVPKIVKPLQRRTNMNSDQVGGAVRNLVTSVGGFLTAIGITSATGGTWETYGGMAATVFGLGWSFYKNRTAGVVASAAAKVPVPFASQQAAGVKEQVTPKA